VALVDRDAAPHCSFSPEVHKALDSRLGREVPIKALAADRMAEEERRRRFIQEARAASALNHPNIITIHDISLHIRALDRLIEQNAKPIE
jgi:serine/threonine protein kinase